MPTFYNVGGAMLSPEQIANRTAEASGEAPVFKSKEALVARIVELVAAGGKNVSAAQRKKYMEMRRDQLEVLVSGFSKKPEAKVVLKKEEK